MEFQQMRKIYGQHISQWKAEAVPYNNYQPFGTLFDRNVPWADTEALLAKPGKKTKSKE